MPTRRARLLILCKTYPSPSSQYVETSCVAAMEESGQLVRLYPVPFRLMQDEAQFKKWQWIEADVKRRERITGRRAIRYASTISRFLVMCCLRPRIGPLVACGSIACICIRLLRNSMEPA
jgi:hypothetical protein